MKSAPIEGFEESYEIYENGDIYAIEREIEGIDGNIYPKRRKKKAVQPNIKVGYLQVRLYKNNFQFNLYVHRLLAIAFIPNPNNLPEVNHKDGNRLNNSLDNLEWVTRVENMQHAIDSGLRTYSNRMTEAEFMNCLQEVIDGCSYKDLVERGVPYKVPFLSTKLRKLAKKAGLEHLLNESLRQQKVERARINGAHNKRSNN